MSVFRGTVIVNRPIRTIKSDIDGQHRVSQTDFDIPNTTTHLEYHSDNNQYNLHVEDEIH